MTVRRVAELRQTRAWGVVLVKTSWNEELELSTSTIMPQMTVVADVTRSGD
jgi:hypothetical protein